MSRITTMWLVTKNAEAVVLMAEGRYKDAVVLFHNILRDIRDVCNDDDMLSMHSTKVPRLYKFATVPLQDPAEGRIGADVEAAVFHSAFLLPTDQPLDLKSAIVVILFNVSLSFHVKAIREGKTADMSKAFGLYAKAQQLSFGFDDRAVMQLIPVMTAIVHNMGSICRAFYQHEHHQAFCELLTHFLGTYGSTLIGDETYAFFQKSLFFDKATANHGAPAA